MRVAIYGRVSTAEQSTVMQLEELRAFCVRRGWDVVEEFTDTGVSGSRESRPALNRLLAGARRRQFDTVLVYRYDRFARSLRQLVNAHAEFDSLGIHFVSLHEGVDTSTPRIPNQGCDYEPSSLMLGGVGMLAPARLAMKKSL
jgi:DNA invertase Pin-like site-specific DNA recombinase